MITEEIFVKMVNTPKYRDQLLGTGTDKTISEYVSDQVSEMARRWTEFKELGKELEKLAPGQRALSQEVNNKLRVIYEIAGNIDEHPEMKEYLLEKIKSVVPDNDKLEAMNKEIASLSIRNEQLVGAQSKQFNSLMELFGAKLEDLARQMQEDEKKEGEEGMEVG